MLINISVLVSALSAYFVNVPLAVTGFISYYSGSTTASFMFIYTLSYLLTNFHSSVMSVFMFVVYSYLFENSCVNVVLKTVKTLLEFIEKKEGVVAKLYRFYVKFTTNNFVYNVLCKIDMYLGYVFNFIYSSVKYLPYFDKFEDKVVKCFSNRSNSKQPQNNTDNLDMYLKKDSVDISSINQFMKDLPPPSEEDLKLMTDMLSKIDKLIKKD